MFIPYTNDNVKISRLGLLMHLAALKDAVVSTGNGSLVFTRIHNKPDSAEYELDTVYQFLFDENDYLVGWDEAKRQ